MSQEEKIIWVTDPETDRYSTLRLINWWDQERLAASRVLVVGAGALGNEVLKNLALLGVGRIIIVDFDKIEASNLSRAVLFRPEHYGRFKAEVAVEQLKQLNPDVKAEAIVGDVATAVGLGLFRKMDVVIGCLDNREARMAVNKACWRVSRPWIDGGLNTIDGLVRVFEPPDGPCYECTMTRRDYDLLSIRYSCPPGDAVVVGSQPTTPTVASIIAGMQVQEAVKILHGLKVNSGRVGYYSGASLRMMLVTYNRKPDCPAHEIYSDIVELPFGVEDLTVAGFLKLANSSVLALDQEVLTYFACPYCAYSEKVYRPYGLVADQLNCPRCGKRRLLDITFSIGLSEDTADVPLSQLGIPKFHIVRGLTENGWRYFELSGDAANLRLSSAPGQDA